MEKEIFYDSVVKCVLTQSRCPYQIQEEQLIEIIRNIYRNMYPRKQYNGGVQIALYKGYTRYLKNCKLVFNKERNLKKYYIRNYNTT